MPEPIAIYPYRPGSREEAEHTVSLENIELDPSELESVVSFEVCLYYSRLPAADFRETQEYLAAHETPPLEESWRLRSDEGEFVVDYFLSPEGQQKFQELTALPPAHNRESARSGISGFDWSGVKKADFDVLSEASIDWAATRFINQFAKNDFQSLENVEEPELLTVVRRPEELASKIVGYTRIKHYLIAVRKDLRSLPPTPENEARRRVAKIYSWHLNYLLAGAMPRAYDLLAQYRHCGSPRLLEQIQNISNSVSFDLASLANQPQRAAEFLQRYDRYRHGVTTVDGRLGVIGDEVLGAIKRSREDELIAETRDYYFNHYNSEDLNRLKMNSQETEEMYRYLLSYYDLLSEETEVDLDRTGWSGDEKWQVIINPRRSSLDVDPKRGLIHVPDGRSRSLIKETSVACHEIAHVVQTVNRRRAFKFRLVQDIGTSRHDTYSEGGGIMWEREAKNWLFGKPRPTRGHYVRAAQALLAGGGWADAAKAYFDSSISANPEADRYDKAKTAFKSSIRLLRAGGQWRTGTNYLTRSQSLSYAEQILVTDKVTPGELLIGRVNPHTLADIKSIGLFDQFRLWIPEAKPWEVLAPYIERKINKQLKS